MVKGDFIIRKGVFMMGSGKIIICMVLGNFIIRVKKLHMRGNGIWINFMEKAKYIMMIMSQFRVNLIIEIFKIWKKNGNYIKVNLIMMRKMGMEN
jgi:hypothetical protein